MTKIIYILFSISLGLLLYACDAPDSNDSLDLLAATNLKTSVIGDAEIKLTWKDNSEYEYGYRLERDSGLGFGLIATLASNTTEYTDNDVMIDSSYSYRVQAFANYKEPSDWSNIATASTYVVRDVDGNEYTTVKIGDQIWMAENLKVTHYIDGTPVPNQTTGAGWGTTTNGAYCYHYNNPENAPVYGALYNWYALTGDLQIAPEGWHIPTIDEWQILINTLGGAGQAANGLKALGDWGNDNGETNISGFSALPGGSRRDSNGYFYAMGYEGDYWSSSDSEGHGDDLIDATFITIPISYSGSILTSIVNKSAGFSVRCVKD